MGPIFNPEAIPEDSRLVVKFFGVALLIVAIYFGISALSGSDKEVKVSTAKEKEIEIKDDCNVYNLSLHGFLDTYVPIGELDADATGSDSILQDLRRAEKDDAIKAVLLEIDSNGGAPTAGEEVANALKNFSKPTVALIRSMGASSAYMAATGAKTIFASQFSEVGSIGVTASFTDQASKNQQEGITFNQLSIGKYKDMFNPDKVFTAEEKALIYRDLKITQENFIQLVAENRGLSVDKVRALADGSSMMGEMALEKGLIDKIGGIHEVEDYLQGLIGEEPKFCW